MLLMEVETPGDKGRKMAAYIKTQDAVVGNCVGLWLKESQRSVIPNTTIK